ncbi:MAG: hypothetical protein HY287_12365 [Planctomycetes bacterium]|nr:hypothetical protein [Planctomycetota bacterium]
MTWRLNRLKWYWRLPSKWLLFAIVMTGVCYPHPVLLYRNIARWQNPNILLNPDSPALQPLVDEVAKYASPARPQDMRSIVERIVLQRIKYEFDWDNWGVMDYFPTVEEIMERGREDCDGRAIIAASLLRHFGIHADVVADFAHVWVRTPDGDLMGPGKAAAVVAGERGVKVNWAALANLPSATAYGVAVFPTIREAMILATGWLLLLHRNRWISATISLVLFCSGLWLLRLGGASYPHPNLPLEWASIGFFFVGIGILVLNSRINSRNRRKSPCDQSVRKNASSGPSTL